MAELTSRLKNKVAIITGAASGIGEAIASQFHLEGGKVLAVDRVNFNSQLLRRFKTLNLDVSSENASEEIVSTCIKAFGKIDILVNNAGVGDGQMRNMKELEAFDEVLSTNLRAVYKLSLASLNELIRTGGNILNISSVFASSGFRGVPGYSASKGAVSAMTRQMAADYGPKGVRINALAPGLIETPLTQKYIDKNPRFYASMIGCSVMGRAGKPKEVARAAAFFCSDDASFITGNVMNVDGGWTDVRHFPEEINPGSSQ